MLQWKEEWPEATLYGCPGLKAKDSAYDEEVGDDAPAAWLGEIEAAHAKYEAVPIFNRPFFSEVALVVCTAPWRVESYSAVHPSTPWQSPALWLPSWRRGITSQVVFFHRPSRMLITTDLFWDYPGHGVPWGTKAWKFGMDRIYAPFYNRYGLVISDAHANGCWHLYLVQCLGMICGLRRLMIKDKEAFKQTMDRIFSWDFDAILPCHGSFVPTGGKARLRQLLGSALKNI